MKHPLLILTVPGLLFILTTTPVQAVTDTWDGGGADNNIATPNNWLDNTAPLSDLLNTDLIFAGTVKPSPNFSAAFSANSLTFNNTSTAFTFSGSTFTVGPGGIVNNDTDTQTFTNPVSIISATSIFNAASGPLTFTGVVNIGGNALTVTGPANTSLSGALGSGSITKSGGGTLNLTSTNTYGFDLALNAGTFNAQQAVTFNGSSAIQVNGGSVFNAVNNLTLDAATFTRAGTSTFTLGSGRILTLQNTANMAFTGSQDFDTSATINVNTGSQLSGTAYLDLASGGAATVNVNVNNATLISGGFGYADWGHFGGTAAVTFSNNATGNIGSGVVLGRQGATGGGTMQVLSGSDVEIDRQFDIGPGAQGSVSSVTVDGAGSTLSMVDGTLVTIGAATGPAQTLTIQNGGRFNALNTVTTVAPTGAVNVTGLNSSFYSNGFLVVNGQFSTSAGGTFQPQPGQNLTAQNGGDVTLSDNTFFNGAGTVAVQGAGSTLTTAPGSGASFYFNNAFISVTGGGLLKSDSAVNIGTAVGSQVQVLGANSELSASTSAPCAWGGGGATSVITYTSGARGTFGAVNLGFGGNGTNATLNIQNSAEFTATGMTVAGTSNTTQATLNVAGTGASLTIQNADLAVGGGSNSTGTVNILTGGTVTIPGIAGDANNLVLFPTATVNVDGGSLVMGDPVSRVGGTLNFISGAITLGEGLTISSTGLLGANLTLGANRRLTTPATVNVDAFNTLTLDGGSLTAANLTSSGTIDFRKGSLNITGAGGLQLSSGGSLGANVTLGAGANLSVTTDTVLTPGSVLTTAGGTLTTGTFHTNGSLRLTAGSISVTGITNNNLGAQMFLADTFSSTGTFTNFDTARVTLQNGTGRLTGGGGLTNQGLITGDGTIAKLLTNGASGEVRAESGKTLYFTGTATNVGQFTLMGGTLDFSSPITNSAGALISGRGTLFTSGLTNSGQMAFAGDNTDIYGDTTLTAGSRVATSGAGSVTAFYDDVIHNGTEIYTGVNTSTVFFGAQSGSGPYTGPGTVYFIGDLRPGNSPGQVTIAPQTIFSPSNILTMEIGGRTAGTQYDKLTFTHAASPQVTWGGTLTIELINGFSPVAGDTFDIFDFDTARDTGTFASITVIDHGLLPPGLAFNYDDLYTTGTIRIVSASGLTFAQWAATALGNPSATPNGDHDKDGFDNATEFALGLFPPQPGTVLPNGGFFTYPDGQRLRLLFTRPLDRTGVTLKVQASTDLTNWTDLAISTNSAPFTGPGFVNENRSHPLNEPGLVEVRDILTSSTAPRRQMRVLILVTP